jgi:hypothetical protein
MNRNLLASCAFFAALTLSLQTEVFAQYSGASARSVRNATRNYLWNRPTVSPYVNLASRDSQFGLSNYFTLVRPQVEAREEAMARQRQTAEMQSQLDQVQNQVRQSQQDAAGMLITGQNGWSARGYPRFGTFLNFYPGFQRIPRR